MKKVICIVLATLFLLPILYGCGGDENSSSSGSKNTAKTTLTDSEKKELAEEVAIREFASKWKSEIGWDIDGVRYNIGSIKEGWPYKVAGKWYWYDSYGSLKYTGTFDVYVEIYDDGTYKVTWSLVKRD